LKRWTKVLAWVAGVLVCLVAAAWVFLFSPLEATGPCGRCGVADTGDVEVAADGTTGLIVYTGARVVPEAYAPITELIGEAGFPVFIPRLTLNFAVFDAQAADSVIREHPEIERWVIAGLSAPRAAGTVGGVSGFDHVAGAVQFVVAPGLSPDREPHSQILDLDDPHPGRTHHHDVGFAPPTEIAM